MAINKLVAVQNVEGTGFFNVMLWLGSTTSVLLNLPDTLGKYFPLLFKYKLKCAHGLIQEQLALLFDAPRCHRAPFGRLWQRVRALSLSTVNPGVEGHYLHNV